MNGILVGIVAAFLVFKKRLKGVLDQFRIEVKHDGPGREDDIDGLDVTIGTNLFEEHFNIVFGARILESTKDLAKGKTGHGQIILTPSCDGVGCNSIVELVGMLRSVAIVLVEEGDQVLLSKILFPERRLWRWLGCLALEENSSILRDANCEENGDGAALANRAEIARQGKDRPITS